MGSWLYTPLLLSVCLLYGGSAIAQQYDYVKQLTVQASRVSGTTDLTDFPLLVNITDPDLRTVGNGGKVRHASGFDILFSEAGYNDPLDYELEEYNPATGKLVAWVRLPTLLATTNTDLYMYYGNGSVTADPSTTNTFNNDYIGVYHFNGDGSDASGRGNDFTGYSLANRPTAITGPGVRLANTSNILSNGSGAYLAGPGNLLNGVFDFTFSGWVWQYRTNTHWERIFDFGQDNNVNFFFTPSHATGSPAEARARITTGGNRAEQGVITGNTSVVGGSWSYWTVTLDSGTGTMRMYRNGVPYGTATGVTITPNDIDGATAGHYFGHSHYTADHLIDAIFDEFRLSSVVRSADWTATEYNNMAAPASFITVGAEQSGVAMNATLPVEWMDFTATLVGTGVRLDWQTLSEYDNARFTVERMAQHGGEWEAIVMLPGKGRSETMNTYTATDPRPPAGTVYYRLRQTDFNGRASYSEVRSMFTTTEMTASAYPNPFGTGFQLRNADYSTRDIRIFDTAGRELTESAVIRREGADVVAVSLPKHPPGLYTVRTSSGDLRVIKQ